MDECQAWDPTKCFRQGPLLLANCKINRTPALELFRQPFCLRVQGRQFIYHTKSCWLRQKLNCKPLTPCSLLSLQGNIHPRNSSSSHSFPESSLLTQAQKCSVIYSKRNLAMCPKLASAGQTESVTRMVNKTKQKKSFHYHSKNTSPCNSIAEHLIVPGV